MALQLRLVFGHRRLFRRERVFRDRTNPFDKFYEREMLERYRFGKDDLWKISDEMLGGRTRVRQYATGWDAGHCPTLDNTPDFGLWRLPT